MRANYALWLLLSVGCAVQNVQVSKVGTATATVVDGNQKTVVSATATQGGVATAQIDLEGRKTASAAEPVSSETQAGQAETQTKTQTKTDEKIRAWKQALAQDDEKPQYPEPGRDVDHPLMRCGLEANYSAVRDYRCEDGSSPLEGKNLQVVAAARRGSTASSVRKLPVDVYLVPCQSGPIELYVYMYACQTEDFAASVARLRREDTGSLPAEEQSALRHLRASIELHLADKDGRAEMETGLRWFADHDKVHPLMVTAWTFAIDRANEGKDAAFAKTTTTIAQVERTCSKLGESAYSECAEAHFALGVFYAEKNELLESAKHLEASARLLATWGGKYEPRIPMVLVRWARVLADENPAQSLLLLRQALRLAESIFGNHDVRVGAVLVGVLHLFVKMDEKQRGLPLFERAHRLGAI